MDDAQDLAALINVLRNLHDERFVSFDPNATSAGAMILPEGRTLVPIENIIAPYMPKPRRRRGVATFRDVDSFIRHVNRFKEDRTAIFIQIGDNRWPTVKAVYNYHAPGEGGQAHCDHIAMWRPLEAREWKAWNGAAGSYMPQATFAEWIEDHVMDIGAARSSDGSDDAVLARYAPGGVKVGSASDLMQVARSMRIVKTTALSQSNNLQTGEAQFMYETTNTVAKGHADITVPSMFFIVIPVFDGGTIAYRTLVRLRYRNAEDGIRWRFDLIQRDETMDLAIDEAHNLIRKQTNIDPYFGAAEG